MGEVGSEVTQLIWVSNMDLNRVFVVSGPDVLIQAPDIGVPIVVTITIKKYSVKNEL